MFEVNRDIRRKMFKTEVEKLSFGSIENNSVFSAPIRNERKVRSQGIHAVQASLEQESRGGIFRKDRRTVECGVISISVNGIRRRREEVIDEK